MQFIPGSHRWGLGEHQPGLADIFSKQLLSLPAEFETVPVILPPGGLSIHSCLTVHCATQNSSPAPRPAYIVRYVAAGCRSMAGAEQQRDLDARPVVGRP